MEIFVEIGFVLIAATIAGYIARLFKQPLIPAYILAGLVLGPMLGVVTNKEMIFTLSEIGIAFLLFIVGLELSFNKLRNVAVISVFGGTLQMILVFLSGILLALALGFKDMELWYIALVVTFSSTMVVIKILSDKKELDTLHGRIIIGILLMQDIFAILALSILNILDNFSFLILLVALFKGIILIALSLLMIIYILPYMYHSSAKSLELLYLLSLSTCFFFSILAMYIGKILMWFFSMPIFGFIPESTLKLLEPGFSIAIGAFIAGIGLANLPYNIEIIGRVKSIRDFFASIFFVSLGLELVIDGFGKLIFPLIMLTLFVVVMQPIIIMFICAIFGYTKRPSFLTAISLAQISEFSLIIVAQGLLLGHVSNEMFSLTILLAMTTIGITVYFINYDDYIYSKISRYLKVFERFSPKHQLEYVPKKEKVDVVVCGYNRVGFSLVKTLKRMKKKILIVDFNPEVINLLMETKIHCIYGDVGDLEIIERMNLKEVEMVISTITNIEDDLLLIKKLRDVNKKAPILVTSTNIPNAMRLYDAGADYVILPHFLGGEHVSLLLEDFTRDMNKLLETKLKHIKELRQRHSLGRYHPRNRAHGE